MDDDLLDRAKEKTKVDLWRDRESEIKKEPQEREQTFTLLRERERGNNDDLLGGRCRDREGDQEMTLWRERGETKMTPFWREVEREHQK